MANIDLIIEFGDDYTYIGYKGMVYKEASLVAFTKKGKNIKVVSIGNQAKKLLGKNDGLTFIEAPFKCGVITNSELAQLYINRFIALFLPNRGFATKIKAIFSINCAINSEEKREYEILAIKCGINQVWFVPSVIAYSLGADLEILESKGKLMVGIGAGCSEIACISQGSIVNGYSIELGGAVIDSAIVSTINEDLGIVISKVTAERIKEEIGSLHPSDLANVEYSGVDALTRVSKNGTIFAKDLYDVFRIAYEKICEAIDIVISQLSADLINDISNDGIYVFGSGSKVTGLEIFLRKRLNVPINLIDDENAGIIGATKILEDKKLLNTIIEKN